MIKAIETVYNGYRFRSRLEARWAVFFDALGIEYQYESEGFDVSGTWYLPDFFLPSQPSRDVYVPSMYVEIKPASLPRKQTKLFGRFGSIECPLALICGQPYGVFGAFEWFDDSDFEYTIEVFEGDVSFHWGKSWFLEGRRTNIITFEGEWGGVCGDEERTGWVGPRIVSAYCAARQARFEHGETPKP